MKTRASSGPVKAKKHLGQHFLKDGAVSQRIAALVPAVEGQPLLEVGPGTGALTPPLDRKRAV